MIRTEEVTITKTTKMEVLNRTKVVKIKDKILKLTITKEATATQTINKILIIIKTSNLRITIKIQVIINRIKTITKTITRTIIKTIIKPITRTIIKIITRTITKIIIRTPNKMEEMEEMVDIKEGIIIKIEIIKIMDRMLQRIKATRVNL